ncbi:MAG: response regulator [Clostridiales bacterium]|nr:response regulator [Clostridiales bacterium]
MSDRNLTLLIVDDELSIRKGLSNSIAWEELGITVLATAKDGLEAFDFIKKYQPDIVLTDIRMPKCDGLELVEKTKEHRIETSFVIISGYDDFKYAQRAIQYGVKNYLLKPINLDEFNKIITELRDSILEEYRQETLELISKKKQKVDSMTLKNIFLSRFIQNEYKSMDEINKHVENYDVKIKNEPLQVVVFELKNPLSNSDKLELTPNDLGLDKLFVSLAARELLQDTSNEVFDFSDNQVVAIVNIPDDNFQIYKVCEHLSFFVQRYSKVEVCIGIGDQVDSFKNISHSFNTGLQALSYSFYETGRKIYDSSIISKEASPKITSNMYDTHEILDAIFRNDSNEIASLTNKFIDSLFYIKMPPPNYIRGMSNYLIISIQQQLGNLTYQDDNLFTLVSEKIKNLATITELKEWMISLFLSYAKKIKLGKTENDPIIEKAKAYIKINLLNNVKADEVAEVVNLSPNYFTTYFREKTNTNFRDYVLEKKMSYAKDLLRQGKKTIHEISQELGYGDYRSFNRAFKNFTNMSPSEFQKLYKEGYGR